MALIGQARRVQLMAEYDMRQFVHDYAIYSWLALRRIEKYQMVMAYPERESRPALPIGDSKLRQIDVR